MSWVENAENKLTIVTGDGKTYTPLYIITPIESEFWLSRYAFINISGELVDRREVKALEIEVEFYFQGADHLDEAEAFSASARDRRAWTVTHPMYGEIICQPAKIRQDSSKFNTSKFNVALIETITDDAPRIGRDPQEQAKVDVANYETVVAESTSNRVDATVSDTNLMESNVETLYDRGKNFTDDVEQAQDYVNLYNSALTKILNYTAAPLEAIRAIRAFIAAPSLFIEQVKNRLNLLKNQLDDLINSIINLATPNEKAIFEDNAGAVVAGMVSAALNPAADDYQNTTDVLGVVGTILDSYNLYLGALEDLQTDNGSDPESYIPDFESLAALENVVNYTVSELFNIALDGRQERELVLEADSNIIELTHRLIGLDAADENITEFRNNNNIGPSEVLGLKKDRIVKYYV